jgi:ABC-type transport system substrate-binding protein
VHYDPNGAGTVRYSGDYELWGVPTAVMQYVGFNLNKGPFASEKLRSAVTYAIDRKAIVAEDLAGFAIPAAYAVRPGTVWDDTLTEKVEYDPQKLQEVTAGQSATMIVCGEYAQRVSTASRIARSLNECGLSVTVKTLSAKEFRQALAHGNFDLYYAEAKLSPDYDLTPFFAKGGACAFGGLGGRKEMTQLCDLVLSNHGNAYDLQRAVQKQGLICPVAFKTTALCIHRNIFPQVTATLGGWLWE